MANSFADAANILSAIISIISCSAKEFYFPCVPKKNLLLVTSAKYQLYSSNFTVRGKWGIYGHINLN